MTLKKAKETLKGVLLLAVGGLMSAHCDYRDGRDGVMLEGYFTAETLEAIAVYMRSTQKVKPDESP